MLKDKKRPYESLNISVQSIVGLVSELTGATISNPDPDSPNPPGPWDPYIRKALIRLGLIFGPVPDPWVPVFGPGPQPWNRVALNPQPLPPKAALAAFIAQEVIDRALLVQEVANALGGAQGNIAGGMISRFIDDCGNDRLWRKRPFPPPKGDDDNRLAPIELVMMGALFAQEAVAIADEQLRQEFRTAGARLTEMGLARL